MSCLLNALGTRTLISDKDKRMNPDKYDGFELGTWDFPATLYFFEDIAGKKCTKKVHLEGLDCEIYKKPAVKKICKVLKDILAVLPDGKLSNALLSNTELELIKSWNGLSRQPVYPKRNPLMLNHKKWYEKLVKIFESEDVIFYSI